MLAAIDANTRVVFVANPNNPTGTWFGPDALESFLPRVPAERVLVVLDEAYIEYAEAGTNCQTASSTSRAYPNLLRFAHLLQGLWPGRRCASAMRCVLAAGGRCAQPRAPAVQRQQPGPGRRLRGAGRCRRTWWRSPGSTPPVWPSWRPGLAALGSCVDCQPKATSSRSTSARDASADQSGPAAARGDRPPGGRLRHADLPARVHRHRGGERPLPRGAGAGSGRG